MDSRSPFPGSGAVDGAEAGSYRIIHPYGQIDFPNVTVADGINFTEDIGSINALNPALGFSGALAGKIGPFLTWPDYADPLVNPGLQVPVLDDQGLPTGEVLQYIGDPNIPHVVVGSPTGNNVFRIQKLVGANYVTVSETEFFTITGKVLPANAVQPATWLFPDAPAQNLFAVGPVNRAGEVGGITPQQPEGIRTGTLYTGYPIGFPTWYQERLQVEDPQNPGTFIDAGGEKLTICPAVDPMCISAPIDPADRHLWRLVSAKRPSGGRARRSSMTAQRMSPICPPASTESWFWLLRRPSVGLALSMKATRSLSAGCVSASTCRNRATTPSPIPSGRMFSRTSPSPMAST